MPTNTTAASRVAPVRTRNIGPLRPRLSDQEPIKHAVTTAGNVSAMLTARMY